MIIKKEYDEIQNYLLDASNFKGFCDSVYFPETTEDISLILKEANKNKTPVTVSGNGTGLTGGRVPQGDIVIATDKLNSILNFDKENKLLTVQPGVSLKEIKDYLFQKGFFYPPDPTEELCFIGGTVATNASGAKTFKYGPTRNFIHFLKIVLPDGEIFNIKRGEIFDFNSFAIESEKGKKYHFELPTINIPEVKNASGYYIKNGMDIIDLFIGSEGTLGIFAEITLKVVDLPENIISIVSFFKSENDALSFINEAREISYLTRKEKSNSNDALALEYFDENSLNFLSNYFPNIPKEAKAAVWFEQETDYLNEEYHINSWLNLMERLNSLINKSWFATDENKRKEIQEFRHAISWKVNDYIAKKNLRKLGTDTAVPDNKFNEFYYFIKNKIVNSGIKYVIYGHLGNSHIHLNMLPENQQQFDLGKKIYSEICFEAVRLDGTVSAEHGIGKIKKEFLLMMYGEEAINKMKKIKNTFDPNNILNRGNLFNY